MITAGVLVKKTDFVRVILYLIFGLHLSLMNASAAMKFGFGFDNFERAKVEGFEVLSRRSCRKLEQEF